ncbi:hypothetical protein FRC17_000901 [Serendipita sp. 399]|nr:hypothetical protein FRC17_000901 [Serendipita sp. 399]
MAPLKRSRAQLDYSSDDSSSSREAERARYASPRKKSPGIFSGLRICIVNAKLRPDDIAELVEIVENNGGRMEANADQADVVVTEIGARKRLERHITWEAAQERPVVSPSWLKESAAANKLQDCNEHLAIEYLKPPVSLPKPRGHGHKLQGTGSKLSPIELSDEENFNPASMSRYCVERQTPLVCPNNDLVAQLAIVKRSRWLDGEDVKALAHSRTIAAIKAYPYKIRSTKQVEKLPHVGPNSLKRISEFLTLGYVQEARQLENDARFQTLSDFTTIYGIGPVNARRFLDMNISTFKDLESYYRRMTRIPKQKENAEGMLTSISLRDEFSVKIARAEVEEVARIIMDELEKIQPGFVHTITGGYRRGKSESNDIDIVFSHGKSGQGRGSMQDLVSRLQKQGLITHLLPATSFRTPGSMKSYNENEALERVLCVFKLPDDSPSFPYNPCGKSRLHRRVDLIFAPIETYWCAVVGWTGSIMFERDIRSWCKEKFKYKFDSSGLTRRSDLSRIPVHSERHLFQLLGLQYVAPTMRNFFLSGNQQSNNLNLTVIFRYLTVGPKKPVLASESIGMPPTTKDNAKKASDIRGFINNSKEKSPTRTKGHDNPKASSSRKAIEISDDDDADSKASHSPHMTRKMDRLILQSDTDMKSVVSVSSDAESSKLVKSSMASRNSTVARKRAHVISSDEEEEEDLPPPKKHAAVAKAGSSKPSKTPVPQKKEQKTNGKKAIVSSSEESSDPPPKKAPGKKSVASRTADAEKSKASKNGFADVLARRAAGPAAPGSKNVPVGEPNCLAGLTLVFTGELDSISREEAQDLAKRYGARVTTAPSSKTSYVVVGNGAGPSKLEVIKKHGLERLNEDEFLNLIRTRKGVLDEKTVEKLRKEEQKIKQEAEEMEKKEREIAKAKLKATASRADNMAPDPTSQLWTTKYAPQNLNQICGNKSNVEKIRLWLHDWPESRKHGFKHAGKNAINGYRALLVYGPPGVGKTTTAHLCAKLEGFTPIELNASDARSKRLVESATNVNNSSLDNWMHGDKTLNSAGVAFTDRTVLIMDEVDGMSAGDRGGVVALKALIKKTQVPIICIANDGQAQKLKPLLGMAANIHFTKPPAAQIKSRIASICYKEKINISGPVIEELIAGAQSDIRQILNMLSTWKLSKGSMDFDESKQLTQSNQKYSIMTPFNCTSKENYTKQAPARAMGLIGPEQDIKTLELLQKASASISDADMVDQMLRGSEQHWSLMPLHACLSLVRPASFMYGQSGPGFSFKDSSAFPQWLGQNSKQNKLQRQLGDIQAKMRMKVSGDKSEIRRYYVPALWPRMVQPFAEKGREVKETIQEVIDVMDEYYLNKDDWDTIVELGVGGNSEELWKSVPTATKTAFTKTYNSSDHPVAFHKGTDLGAPIKKIAAKDIPDVEEAFDIDDEIPEDEEDVKPKAKEKTLDDKLVKEVKPKASAAGKKKK